MRRWIFLGWSVDVNVIFKKGTRKNRGTEFDLSLYSSKLGVDIFYRRTGDRIILKVAEMSNHQRIVITVGTDIERIEITEVHKLLDRSFKSTWLGGYSFQQL